MPERSLSSSTDRLVTWLGSCARRHMAYVYQGRRDAPHAGVLLPSTRSHVLRMDIPPIGVMNVRLWDICTTWVG